MSVCLETARLILRDYVPEDLDAYFRLKTDEETMYYLQDIRLSSREEAEREFAEVLADAVSPDRRFYFLHMEENLLRPHGVGLIFGGVVRVQKDPAVSQVGRHGPGVGRVHPVVGVEVAVVVAVVAVVVLVVVVGQALQQFYPR